MRTPNETHITVFFKKGKNYGFKLSPLSFGFFRLKLFFRQITACSNSFCFLG